MLSIENRTSAHARGQTTTASCNIHKCCMQNVSIFKFGSTTPNMLQNEATRRKRVAQRATCCDQNCRDMLPFILELKICDMPMKKVKMNLSRAHTSHQGIFKRFFARGFFPPFGMRLPDQRISLNAILVDIKLTTRTPSRLPPELLPRTVKVHGKNILHNF